MLNSIRTTPRESRLTALLLTALLCASGSAEPAKQPAGKIAATHKLAGTSVSLSAPVMVYSQHNYLWFPTLVRLGNGDLWAVMSNYADEATNRPTGLFCRSTDDGLTWSSPKEYPYCDCNIRLPTGDNILIPYYLFPAKSGMTGTYLSARQGAGELEVVKSGLTVAGLPRKDRIDQKNGVSGFVFNGETVPLADGSHLGALYGNFEKENRYSLLSVVSRDGKHWRYRSTVADARCPLEGVEGPCESAFARLKDGRLLCVFRLHSGAPLGQTYSSDEGRTWSAPVSMRGPRSVQPSLAVLKSGIVLLTTGRPGISLWLNADGKAGDWQEIDLVKHHNASRPAERFAYDKTTGSASNNTQFTAVDGTSSYTEIVALDDKNLLCIYDTIPPGWNRDPLPSKAQRPNSVWVIRVTVQSTAKPSPAASRRKVPADG